MYSVYIPFVRCIDSMVKMRFKPHSQERYMSMANFPKYEASLTVKDNAGRPSVVSFYVPFATAQAYWAAADKAARDATTIGVFFTKLMACVDGVEVSRQVTLIDETDPFSLPASGVVRGNKIVIAGTGGGKPYIVSLPTRKASSYTLKPNSIDIDIEAVGAFATFVDAIGATAVDSNGNSINVTKAYLND